jgi:phage repressor protein C with HTH and peptisase S24 domain
VKARSIGRRLKAQRTQLGLSQSEMARKAGMPLTTYKKYELDQRIPGGEALAGLIKAGVNAADLLIGDADSPVEYKLEQPGAGYVYLPLYELRPGTAARGVIVEDGERPVDALAFKEDWIRNTLRARPGDLRLIYVEGDSMEPDWRAGDIILIDHTDTMARREGIYVVRMDDALLVKQVQRMPGGVVKLTSRNPAYEPITLPVPAVAEQGKYAIIGRVVWACRRF